MDYLNKTILYPIPTEWLGQEQDDDAVGIITYRGPAILKIWYEKDENGNPTDRINQVFDGEDPSIAERPLPLDVVQVELDANEHPLHAAALYPSCVDMPRKIPVKGIGPEDKFEDPLIQDPCHLFEAYDMHSFGKYDHNTGTWGKPEFSPYDPDSFGWEWVRAQRDADLRASDNRVPADAPESVKAPWLAYRQALRDLPEAWAGVGTETRLIAWPMDPEANATAQRVLDEQGPDPFL